MVISGGGCERTANAASEGPNLINCDAMRVNYQLRNSCNSGHEIGSSSNEKSLDSPLFIESKFFAKLPKALCCLCTKQGAPLFKITFLSRGQCSVKAKYKQKQFFPFESGRKLKIHNWQILNSRAGHLRSTALHI